MTARTTITARKGMIQSLLRPGSSLSMKILVVAGSISWNKEAIRETSMTNSAALPAPLRRFLAKSSVLLRSPEGSKASPGSSMITTPVKPRSNSSSVMVSLPRAGSFRYTFPERKPSSTTK